MIRGVVNENDEPVVPIDLILRKRKRRFRAVLDTGFNGYLSVPESLVQGGRWYFAGYEEYEIATGDKVRERVYLGDIIFDGKRCTTHIVTSHSKDILIGTRLLSDKQLHIHFGKRKVWIK